MVIGPNGGTITSLDSVLTIAILPGALEEDVELFIESTNEPPDVYGAAYLVRPNPELLIPASVTYRTTLPTDTTGLAVGAVDAVSFESGQGNWEALPVAQINLEQQLVTGIDDGISIFYALLSDAEPSATTGDPNPTTGNDDADPGTTTGEPMTTGGEMGDTTGDPTTSGDAETTDDTAAESSGEPAISFAETIQPIINANCECHTAGEPAGLSMADGYANLVDVASTEAAGLDRIEPGVPADSYLWHKINNTHIEAGGEGNPMPAPDGGLAPDLIDTIEQWILDGAEP
ncbi:MAG: hypothetical protein AAF799_24815 [Myxococcota bacterium]